MKNTQEIKNYISIFFFSVVHDCYCVHLQQVDKEWNQVSCEWTVGFQHRNGVVCFNKWCKYCLCYVTRRCHVWFFPVILYAGVTQISQKSRSSKKFHMQEMWLEVSLYWWSTNVRPTPQKGVAYATWHTGLVHCHSNVHSIAEDDDHITSYWMNQICSEVNYCQSVSSSVRTQEFQCK